MQLVYVYIGYIHIERDHRESMLRLIRHRVETGWTGCVLCVLHQMHSQNVCVCVCVCVCGHIYRKKYHLEGRDGLG